MRCQLLGVLVISIAACQAVADINERTYTISEGDGGDMDERTSGSGGAGRRASAACTAYCDSVSRICTDEFAVYSDAEQCLRVCASLETNQNASDMNTLSCRTDATQSALSEPQDCAIAGPGGAGHCGANCESYCHLMSVACAGTDEYKDFWLADVDKCIAACAALRDRDREAEGKPTASKYSALNTQSRDHNGDTVQCRLFHASVATSPTGPPVHCWHAQLAPRPNTLTQETNPCLGDVSEVAPRCKDVCRIMKVACPGDLKPYDDEEQCNAVCEKLDPGTLDDDGSREPAKENTVGCRKTHAYNALLGVAATHCPHAGPGGAHVCGDDCASYCMLLERTCAAQFSQFGDRATCEAQCKDWAGDEPLKNYSVALATSESAPPLACRLHQLSIAASALATMRDDTPQDMSLAAAACDAAVGNGGC